MNKMKRQLHRVFALLLGCVLLCCPAFAEESCSLWVNILDAEREAISHFNVELLPVTTFDGTDHVLLPDYDELGVTAAELDADHSAERAERVFQYMHAKGLSGRVVSTGRYGVADFGRLDQGIYLVFDRGNQIFTFPPYLVELPTQTPDGPVYHLNSEPKTVSTDSQTLMVAIEWLDDDNAAGKRPDAVEVSLLRDTASVLRAAPAAASVERTVILSPTCHWQHTFHTLPYGSVYTVEGSAVPKYKLVQIEEVMEGFILYYKYTPSPEPPNPPGPGPGPGPGPFFPDYPGSTPSGGEETLPQTGFRLLPVYALLGVGSLLVVLGLVDLCTKKREEP